MSWNFVCGDLRAIAYSCRNLEYLDVYGVIYLMNPFVILPESSNISMSHSQISELGIRIFWYFLSFHHWIKYWWSSWILLKSQYLNIRLCSISNATIREVAFMFQFKISLFGNFGTFSKKAIKRLKPDIYVKLYETHIIINGQILNQTGLILTIDNN